MWKFSVWEDILAPFLQSGGRQFESASGHNIFQPLAWFLASLTGVPNRELANSFQRTSLKKSLLWFRRLFI